MPAYFSINISIKSDDIYEGIYSDFVDTLQKEGLKFQSGTWEFMDESLDSIIKWNEQKLKERFHLGYDEHYSNDYRQIFLDYHGFSEVRFFIIYSKEHDEFVFTMIIPEDELLKWDSGRVTYDPEILNDIKKLITNIWNFEYVSAIQTTLELSGEITYTDELERGVMPSIVPLAIIPKAYVNDDFDENDKVCDVSREGILIECL